MKTYIVLIVAFFSWGLVHCLNSKEICEANTTIMCPMCEETCDPWTLSDSCVYAKVSAILMLITVFQQAKDPQTLPASLIFLRDEQLPTTQETNW